VTELAINRPGKGQARGEGTVTSTAEVSADRWWAAARDKAVKALIQYGCTVDSEFSSTMRWVRSPEWVPPRKPPYLPSKWKIASYWAERDDWFEVDLERPHCFACGLHGGYRADEPGLEYRWNGARRLERGHIVNRARDGLDAVQNLVPLCRMCNRVMPVFDAGHDEEAASWIFAGGVMGEYEKRLEEKGLNWAERGIAYLQVMEQRGGLAVGDGQIESYYRFLSRLLPAAA
jgi:hypothetical protein